MNKRQALSSTASFLLTFLKVMILACLGGWLFSSIFFGLASFVLLVWGITYIVGGSLAVAAWLQFFRGSYSITLTKHGKDS